jgi:uncharacterized membrane protein YeaQ/YmgE (transglycosylase-associated protein family)
MKRYLIFAALGPFLGGFLLLFATTYTSGYWTQTNAAVDDILFHVKRINWVLRMLIVGAVGFIAAELLYGSRGQDSGVIQFLLYGLVGFVPATISSWLSHKYAEPQPAPAASSDEQSRVQGTPT